MADEIKKRENSEVIRVQAQPIVAVESCFNCNSQIGRLETPFLFRERIVCSACFEKLRPKQVTLHDPPPLPARAPAPQPQAVQQPQIVVVQSAAPSPVYHQSVMQVTQVNKGRGCLGAIFDLFVFLFLLAVGGIVLLFMMGYYLL